MFETGIVVPDVVLVHVGAVAAAAVDLVDYYSWMPKVTVTQIVYGSVVID